MVSAIGFTTREFADLIGVEEYMVRFWIEGERMPNSRESRKLWEAYRRFSEAQKKKVHLLSHVGRMTPEKEKYQ
jgi:DNA-binding transcriptional MerR regulator